MLGRPCDLNPASATAFYGALFGWDAADLSAASRAGTCCSGTGWGSRLLYRQTTAARAAPARPHWTSCIAVRDADATSARAAELGGEAVFREAFDVLDEGRVAAIRDPSAAIISVWQAGVTLVESIGALSWNEFVTLDVARAASFYGGLFGWTYETDSRYTTIWRGGRLNGGIRRTTHEERREAAEWRPYFMVESVDDAVRTAEEAGGRTLSPPDDGPIGRFALVRDPQGAGFGLLDRTPAFDGRR